MRKQFAIFSVVLLLSACSGNKENKVSTAISDQPENAPSEQLSELPGKKLYNQHCLACHQSDGNGVPGMFPSLQNTKWVNGDVETLVNIVINGMDEEIEVNGEYFNTIMAPMPHLTNQEVADILTYVRKEFGTNASAVTAEEVKNIRNSGS